MNSDAKSSPNVMQAVPFFMIVNMENSLDFYINGLGFTLKNKWEPGGKIEWCWLQHDEASLMLQEYRKIPDIEELGEGVSILGNNLLVIQLKDPHGYNIHFESPTDVPEETIYSDWVKAGNK